MRRGCKKMLPVMSYYYTSSKQIFGLPLLSIAFGPHPTSGKKQGHARGVLAIGDVSTGIVACGGIARGFIACGGVSLGFVSTGGVSIGALSVGGTAVGALAIGGVAAGLHAIGGVAFGIFSALGGIASHLF